MAIEMKCPGCSQILRVEDAHAGKQARCPQCGTITRVPSLDETPLPEESVDVAFSGSSPFAGSAADEPNPFADHAATPYASPTSFPQVSSPARYQRPHRGGTILTFGILGLLCCFLFAIAAWTMGSADLREIRRGTIDQRGKGLTQAGMVLGIIGTILGILGIGVQILVAIAEAAA